MVSVTVDFLFHCPYFAQPLHALVGKVLCMLEKMAATVLFANILLSFLIKTFIVFAKHDDLLSLHIIIDHVSNPM